jgi:hypothetical protein
VTNGLAIRSALRPHIRLRSQAYLIVGASLVLIIVAMLLADVYAADDLAVAALWLGAQDVVSLGVEPYIGRLDRIADQLRLELGAARGSDRLSTLTGFMAEQLPLRAGRPFYMQETMDTGQGLQMLCCAAWISVARRAGLDAYGLDVPGWFLARIDGIVVDVASGGVVLSEKEARKHIEGVSKRAQAAGMSPIQADPSLTDPQEMLNRPVTVSAFLVRLNRNLVGGYTRLAQEAATRERMFG